MRLVALANYGDTTGVRLDISTIDVEGAEADMLEGLGQEMFERQVRRHLKRLPLGFRCLLDEWDWQDTAPDS